MLESLWHFLTIFFIEIESKRMRVKGGRERVRVSEENERKLGVCGSWQDKLPFIDKN